MKNKKIFVVGAQCTGKNDLINTLVEKYKYRVAKLDTDYPSDLVYENPIYNIENYNFLTRDTIEDIFDLNYNIFIKTIPNTLNRYYEALSLDEYDQSDIFFITIEQFVSIPLNKLNNEDTLIVWLDNSYSKRKKTFINEYRIYDFIAREKYENSNMNSFMEYINKINNKIYFLNEEVERISYIVNLWKTNEDESKKITTIFN